MAILFAGRLPSRRPATRLLPQGRDGGLGLRVQVPLGEPGAPDGKTLASGGADATLRLRDLALGW